MSAKDDGVAWGMCAAYDCPLFGSFGVSGKWYCCCHFRVDASANDAITAALHRHKNLVDEALALRGTFAGGAAIKEVEDQLVELTAEIGRQKRVPTAKVIGPTHAMTHYTEASE